MKLSSTSTGAVKYLLAGAVLLEVLAQTYGFYWKLPIAASLVYFAAGLAVALIPVWKDLSPGQATEASWIRIAGIGLFTLLAAWCLWRNVHLVAAAPLDYRQADMLPILETMAQRRLNGAAIYAPIEAIWAGMRPIYLPAMWLPFLPAVWLQLDIRWVSALLLVAVMAIIVFGTGRQKGQVSIRLIAWLALILLYYYIFGLYNTLITLSEEPVVVFYYLLLAWALFRRWPVLTGLAIALCLLSRYSLVFWVPVYLVYQFFYRSRREAYTTAAALAGGLILLLTIGQAWDQLGFFLQLQESYLDELLDPDKSWSFIAQIGNNPGLIKFLPFSGIASWHRLLIIGSILIPPAALWLFRKYRSGLQDRFFGLCSLKLCLVYFYNMLTIPYSYLFYPSTFLSLFILFAAFSDKNDA
ncbi:hypothetical protein [Flavilitoribacter nigricans]|uniref:DUF2029 domain-containing protein n=1 Tax=Flavilitoribacter nigricans (strain ATCC 23147 / DSM 23189 / NBRC 102662 / NCIMB 1420 / SS-2) TaxID=1122177 RepID=A0A2D0N3Q0_FLAN2|nr:hypothetical protein [Flavilitoribacter nigricans]PHN03020.1 hypothetical protein CRP01_28460 [Flavilitoribacter nigricans DSM 23189 = NBRC 102662]